MATYYAAKSISRAPRARWCSRGRFNVIAVALCFAIIFSAYNTLQNYITTLFPTLGQNSLTVLYAVAGVSVFASPALTNAFGPRATMFAGAACYVLYIASLATASAPLMLATSAVIGFGAAILWVALGVFITQNSSPHEYATNTGIFWAVFQLNNIFGNLVTWAVYTPALANSPYLCERCAGAPPRARLPAPSPPPRRRPPPLPPRQIWALRLSPRSARRGCSCSARRRVLRPRTRALPSS